MNYDDPDSSGFHGMGRDPTIEAKLNLAKKMAESKRAREAAATGGGGDLSTKDDVLDRLTKRVNENSANTADALAVPESATETPVTLTAPEQSAEPAGDVEVKKGGDEVLPSPMPQEKPDDEDSVHVENKVEDPKLSKEVQEIFKKQAVSEKDENLYGGGHVDEQKSDVIEAVKEGLRESVEVEKVKIRPLSAAVAESNQLFKDMIVKDIRDLTAKNGGEIPPEEVIRSSIKRAFREDERKQFDLIYREMAMGAVFEDVPDVKASETVTEPVLEPVSAVPAEIATENAPDVAVVETVVPVDEWDSSFSTPREPAEGSKEGVPPPPPPDKEKPVSSWTPVRKGVVGRAAGSEDRDAVKNTETGQWEFSEKIIEEKRQEMEKALAEKKKAELATFFAEEAAKLGNEEFDDSYLLAMIIDRRAGKPLDPEELALYRNLFAERYHPGIVAETKEIEFPKEKTAQDSVAVEEPEKAHELTAEQVAENLTSLYWTTRIQGGQKSMEDPNITFQGGDFDRARSEAYLRNIKAGKFFESVDISGTYDGEPRQASESSVYEFFKNIADNTEKYIEIVKENPELVEERKRQGEEARKIVEAIDKLKPVEAEPIQTPEVVVAPVSVVESVPTKEEQEEIDNELRMLFSGDDPEVTDHVSVLSMTEDQVEKVDAVLDAQDEEELSPLSAAEAGLVDFSKATTWEELAGLINSVEKIEGSSETFERAELLDRLEKVRARKISVAVMTRTGGLRAKVIELMLKEAGSIEDFYAIAPVESVEAPAAVAAVATPETPVVEAVSVSAVPEISEERQKLNSILKLLRPEADPLDPRNDARVMVMVDLAFREGMAGDEMRREVREALEKPGENVGAQGGGIGTIKAKWVEEAYALGKAIHARGGEHAVAVAVPPPAPSIETAPVVAPPITPETISVATPASEEGRRLSEDMSELPPLPDLPPAGWMEETPEEALRRVSEEYERLTPEQREEASVGMLNWGWSLKKFTGNMLASAVPAEMRNNNQLLDVWARRRERDAQAAEIKLREAREDKLAEENGAKVGKMRKGRRIAGSVGVIGGMSARIGRPVASAFGLMPLGGVMLSSLAMAETAGIVKDYNEQTVANSQRGNEDYRKREDETEEEYIARTSGGGAMDEAWELYNQAKLQSGSDKPTKEQIDEAYFKNLPAELEERLGKTPPSTRDWWFQRKMQARVREKVAEIHHVMLGDKHDGVRGVYENIRDRRYKKILDRYARLIDDSGTVHSFALAAVQAEKVNKGIVTVLSVDAWRRGAVGVYRMASNFFDGDAKIKIPGLSQGGGVSKVSAAALTPEQLAAQAQTVKSRMSYDAVKNWLASQKDKNAALASMREELATGGTTDPAHTEALKEILKEEEAAAVVANAETAQKAALKLESDRKAAEAIAARERQKALELEEQQRKAGAKGARPEVADRKAMLDAKTAQQSAEMVKRVTERFGIDIVAFGENATDQAVESRIAVMLSGRSAGESKAILDTIRGQTYGNGRLNGQVKSAAERLSGLDGVVNDWRAAAALETSLPAEVIRPVDNAPAERVISDYLAFNEQAARRLGWNGKEDVANWASVRAHGMWIEYAESVLTPVKRAQLQQMNLSGDAQGLAELLRKDPQNVLKFNFKSGTVEVIGDEFFKKDALAHGGGYAAALTEAENRLAEQERLRAKAGTMPKYETSGLPRIRQTIDQIVYDGNANASMRAKQMSAAIRSGSVSPNAFATYFAQQMKMPENSQSVVSLLKALEDLRGTPGQQANAELTLTINMQNMMMTHPQGPAGGGIRLGEKVPLVPGKGSSLAPEGYSVKIAEAMNPIVNGPGDSTARVEQLLSMQRQGKIDAEAFAHYYAQQLDANIGQPQFDADGKKRLVLASESSVLEMRRIFASAMQYPPTQQSLAAKRQLASMISGMTRRK